MAGESEVRNAVADLAEILKWHSKVRASISFESIVSFNDQAKSVSDEWIEWFFEMTVRATCFSATANFLWL